jgi:glycerol-3-phosphate acyltransferase PlsY
MMNNFFLDLCSGIVPWYVIVISAVGTYFLGNINPAILIGRAKGIDIRAKGSGNAGATNAARSLGKKAGAATFLIDVVKGWAGFYILIAIWGASAIAPAMLCGLCVVLGHMYPVFFGFRGGKGVATVFGVLLAASWLYALILLGIVIVCTLLFKRVSLSSMIAAAAAIVLVFLGGPLITEAQPLWVIILMALVVWKHRSNIKRLIKGEEPKFSLGGKTENKK